MLKWLQDVALLFSNFTCGLSQGGHLITASMLASQAFASWLSAQEALGSFS